MSRWKTNCGACVFSLCSSCWNPPSVFQRVLLAELHILQWDTVLCEPVPSYPPSTVAYSRSGSVSHYKPKWEDRIMDTNQAVFALPRTIFCHFKWIKGSWCCPFNHVKQIMLVRQRRSIGEASGVGQAERQGRQHPLMTNTGQCDKVGHER